MKKIILMFLSAEKLAKWAAEGIQIAVNKSSKTEQIAKYGQLADKITEYQKFLTDTLKDGQIDQIEKEQIEKRLLPVMSKLMELI